ncbi:MAG: hypothetical protein L6R19_15845 [Alphaproteobacteria bacterium]|nr:hypothetical protein [Alphaproteobacteria bacterium]
MHRYDKVTTAALVAVMCLISMPALAQGYKVGDAVMCDGSQIGKFERAKVIAIQPRPGWPDPFYKVKPDSGGSEYLCLQKFMKPAAAAAVPAPAPVAAPPPAPKPPAAVAAPASPPAPAPKPAAAPAAAGGAPPDGSYSCHKMSPGAPLMQVGHVDVRGGKPVFREGLPDGWKLRQIRYQGPNERGQPLIVVEYTSKAGFHDKLDCVPEVR